MRLAVIGGGLFGSTAAIHAARAGHDVHLLEGKPDLMLGATAGTYSRLHRGYHYPRSPQTGRESRKAEALFRAEYGAAVVDGGRQFYIVPPNDNRVSRGQYRFFLKQQGLPFQEDGGVFEVKEPRINLAALQAIVRQKVKQAGVKVHLRTAACSRTAHLRQQFDHIVVAAYSGLNPVLELLGCSPAAYKFQVVEKPIVLLPAGFRGVSLVVIDGPYGCIDPLDDTPAHVLGHVVHTVHAESVGLAPVIPGHLVPLVDKGFIRNPPCTKLKDVVADLARYVPGVETAIHLGSMFTVRAVLAHQEKTDARPTLLTRHDPQVTSVFSGKLGTSVSVAKAICDSLATEHREAA